MRRQLDRVSSNGGTPATSFWPATFDSQRATAATTPTELLKQTPATTPHDPRYLRLCAGRVLTADGTSESQAWGYTPAQVALNLSTSAGAAQWQRLGQQCPRFVGRLADHQYPLGYCSGHRARARCVQQPRRLGDLRPLAQMTRTEQAPRRPARGPGTNRARQR